MSSAAHTRLAALFLQITDIDALGLERANGLILSEAFYWDLNDATRAFAKRFAERMDGRMPTEDQAGVYSETLAYLRAAKAADTIEGDKVVAAMKKAPIEDPLFGRVVVRPDGRATHPMYVFRVKAPAASKGRWDVYDLVETIPADEAFRPLVGRRVSAEMRRWRQSRHRLLQRPSPTCRLSTSRQARCASGPWRCGRRACV